MEKNMNPIDDITENYIKVIRPELDWLYLKLTPLEKLKLEHTLSEFNKYIITILTSSLIENQIKHETRLFDEAVSMFKLSNN
jgi:hypothetical protein